MLHLVGALAYGGLLQELVQELGRPLEAVLVALLTMCLGNQGHVPAGGVCTVIHCGVWHEPWLCGVSCARGVCTRPLPRHRCGPERLAILLESGLDVEISLDVLQGLKHDCRAYQE